VDTGKVEHTAQEGATEFQEHIRHLGDNSIQSVFIRLVEGIDQLAVIRSQEGVNSVEDIDW